MRRILPTLAGSQNAVTYCIRPEWACGWITEFTDAMRLFLPRKANLLRHFGAATARWQTKDGLPHLMVEQSSKVLETQAERECPVGHFLEGPDQSPNAATYARLLLACGNARNLAEGKRVHEHLTGSGLEQDAYIGNILVSMYGKCGSLEDARAAFNKIHQPNVISWSALIAVYAEHGKCNESLGLFQQMQLEGVAPNNVTFVNLLKAFGNRGALAQGKLIHARIVESGYESDCIVATTLVNMYGKCGSLEDARAVFDKMPLPGTVSWSVVIAAFVSHGDCKEALRIFHRMHLEGVMPDKITFINTMTACSSPKVLAEANVIHACISEHDCRTDATVGNGVMNMYGKCGNAEDARRMFDELPEKNVVSWNSMISIYVQHGKDEEALVLFRKMLLAGGLIPNKVTFASILTACGNSQTLEGIVSCMANSGVEADVVVQTVLVNMYAELGKLQQARNVFEMMHRKDVVLWNVVIAAYANRGFFDEAYQLCRLMLLGGEKPDRVTFIAILDAFVNLACLSESKLIHSCIVEAGLDSDTVVNNAVINMYGKCGRLEEAERVFAEKKHGRDVVSWNAMLGAYAENGYCREALQLFQRMQLEGTKPDKVTFMGVVAACTASEDFLPEGKKVHGSISESGFELVGQVGNSLISMYGKCGSPGDACRVFEKMQRHDVVSWTALLATYEQLDAEHASEEALVCFRRMRLEGVMPSKVTFVMMLNGCAAAAALAEGKLIHSHIGELELEIDAALGAALIDMYGECGSPEDALEVFEKATERDVVSWNAMISSCAKLLAVKEILRLFQRMLLEGMKPSRITFATLLDVLTDLAALAEGKIIHNCVVETGLESDTAVGNGLVNLYGKCGNLDEANRMFERMPKRNAASWNTMVAAYAQHGHAEDVINLFERMQQEGMEPNNGTFVSILSSCSHAGIVEVACQHFYAMQQDFGITPTSGENGCVIDLLGRAGRLQEAEDFVKRLPSQPDEAVMWSTLLAACNMHGDVERGKRAAGRVLDLQPRDSAGYVALSNICCAAAASE